MKQQDIGHQIIQARKKLKYTQKELGDKLGVSDKTISKWERGNGYPDISMLLPLCQELGIEVAQLLGEEDTSSEVTERNMKTLTEYAVMKVKENRERICRVIWVITSVLSLLGIGICYLVNYIMSSYLDWSMITAAAILYGWLILTPMLMARQHQISKSIAITVVLVFPFLYVISLYLPMLDFFQFAWKIAFAGDVLLICIYLIWKRCQFNFWYKLAIIVSLSAVFSCFVNILSGDRPGIVYIQVISNALAAIACICVGYYRTRRMSYES